MRLHESLESIRDITVDAIAAGKVAVAQLIIKPLDWVDEQLCKRNDLGDE